MFLSHFNLIQHPFMENPPIDWILTDPRFEQALARLKFFQDQGTIALIVGQTGIGKSTLLRRFIYDLPQNRYRPIYVHLTPINANAFLRLIVTKLGETPRIGKDRLFLQITDRIVKNEKCTILIIDECHMIDPKALTDLRLLVSAFNTELPLKIILSGQENLAQILNRSSHADLVHRICVRSFLNPFTKDQSLAYIDSRMTNAGGSERSSNRRQNTLSTITPGACHDKSTMSLPPA